jgi:hypothetical protein
MLSPWPGLMRTTTTSFGTWCAGTPTILQRRERGQQIVAAFDNEREWGAFLDQAAAELGQDRAAGLVTDPSDHYTGLVLEPGSQRRQQNRRLIRRALERGADISAFLAGLDLPSNMAIIRAENSHDESA